jgi:thiosulfate sulfurtransferase
MGWQRIAPQQAAVLIVAREPVLVDVRDGVSYGRSRIPGALHLDNRTAGEFVEDADKSRPVVVYCYHGNSSQGAAAWLSEQGFAEVYSLDGGFEVWRLGSPVES